MAQIPGYPLGEESVSWPAQVGSTAPYPYWVSVTGRSLHKGQSRRGTQYELDAVQAGEYRGEWDNRDGAITPGNASGMFSPNVKLMRPYRRRMQYPLTQNLLTGDQAASGDATPLAAGTLLTSFQMGSAYDTAAQIVASGTAWQGSQVTQMVLPGSSSTGSMLVYAVGWTVTPGLVYSLQLRVRCVTSGQNPQVRAVLQWVDATGTNLTASTGSASTLTGATSASWTQVTVSGTAPSNAAGCQVGVALMVAPSGSSTIQTDGWQVEQAAAPTTWTQPGTWYPITQGWIERLPQSYDFAGTWAQVQPTVVDSFAYLSQRRLLACFYNDVVALGPRFFFPLDDPSGVMLYADLTGNFPSIQAVASQYGGGTITSGTSITSTTAGQGFVGAPGPVLTMNQTSSNAFTTPGSWLALDGVGIRGPVATTGWTRMIAFRSPSPGTAASNTLWNASGGSWTTAAGGFFVALASQSDGSYVRVAVNGATVPDPNGISWDSGTGYSDGNWHLLIVGCSADGRTIRICLDGAFTVFTPATSQNPTNVSVDEIGAYFLPGNNYVSNNYVGDLAHIGEFPTALTAAQMTALYTSWRTAYSGESTNARYARILGWAGYQGQSRIATGNTTSMGSASDVAGQDALTALQGVVTSENGRHYVARDGTLVFENRAARYSQLTPKYVFGDNAGEWGYEAVTIEYDRTRIANDVQVTQYAASGTGQVLRARDTAVSQPQYGAYTLTRTLNVTSISECQDAANYLLSRYSQPLQRLKTLRLHPGAQPSFWPVCLDLEISTRVRVMRRPPGGAPAIQIDGFVESLTWDFDNTTGDAFLQVEVSPANLTAYWVLSALHTTLSAQGTAGASSVTVNALPDAATNPFSASVPSGLQLTLEPGTSRAETLTVSSVSTTSPGYSTCTVVFTGTLGFTHAAGSVACEALPAGVTDPTTYDSASVLGTTTILSY